MKTCNKDKCNRIHEAHGLCKMHYNRAVRNKEIETIKGRGRPRVYSDEERLERAREKARIKYWKKKLLEPKKEKQMPPRGKSLLSNAKNRAKSKNLPFNLTLDDIIIPNECPLLNIPLQEGIGIYTDNSPTLDRIVPELGYVKGNIQVISMRANRIKDNASFEEFERIYFNWKSLNSK